ncbi:hypothetical protein EJ06DRAFT_580233 [Trichodelitschia bisporula]|uniref:PQ loop repeat protein n=1 Tax=Trichodelitschia bisporula TaxID=703511 RepID=A0A6G1I4R4_9PEZI|nr:hypothetical protein EJ06DRAFT_580233 [Trichodelitschia bisporula]
MGIFHWLITHVTPLFLVTSPLTSYGDQIHSMHRARSSAGFSLDIPLIMLVASILKIFYWIGARYDSALLIQALVMIVVQVVLLYVALTHRPPPLHIHAPAGGAPSMLSARPYNFWRWDDARPYWLFIGYFAGALVALQVLLGTAPGYSALLGYIALAIEATLPLPQIMANHQRKCCRGFRVSVLGNWLLGDTFKMVFFFAKGSADIPWAFKLCGVFQACCDSYLGVQYWMYGSGEMPVAAEESKGGVVWREGGREAEWVGS